jgi:electron transfer flavoprotein beta subunit
MAAKKKELTTLTLADLGLDAAQVGAAGATSEVVDFALRPPRAKGQIVTDEGDGGVKLADFLVAEKIV